MEKHISIGGIDNFEQNFLKPEEAQLIKKNCMKSIES